MHFSRWKTVMAWRWRESVEKRTFCHRAIHKNKVVRHAETVRLHPVAQTEEEVPISSSEKETV
jgi:hypothetical protein